MTEADTRGMGLVRRITEILKLGSLLPADMSDEEMEGILYLVAPDLTRTITALLAPRARVASLAIWKMWYKWLEEARTIKEEGGKVILVPFNFPVEAIHSFRKAKPLTSEVLTTVAVSILEGQGEPYWDFAMGLGMPDSLCSANVIALGSVLMKDDMVPDALIQTTPGACDANAKIHEFVSNRMHVPQFLLEKPTDNTTRAKELYVEYFRRVLEGLQELLDEELDEEHVRDTMERANRCTELYYEYFNLQKHIPCPIPNVYSFYLYGVRYSMWGREEGIEVLETMIGTCKDIIKRGDYPVPEERARAIWIYLPYYFDFVGMYQWMEDSGITIIGDGLDSFFPPMIDTTSMETMIEGMAETAWNACMTRQMGAPSMHTQWLEDILYNARELSCNLAIFCGHHSCKQTWSVISMVRDELQKRAGVPTLCLQGDSWIKRMTPTSALQEEIISFVDNVVDREGAARKRRAAT